MHQGVDSYPLYWPEGWARSRSRYRSRYQVAIGKARDDLVKELRRLRAEDVVISTNVPTRRDGLLPRVSPTEPIDPGVAVYWSTRKWDPKTQNYVAKPLVIACDYWDRVRDNIRACGLTIAAIRQIKRAGATDLLERAFLGFAALPSSVAINWRFELGLAAGTVTRLQVEEAYKREAMARHPDRGGSHEAMVRLNAAREMALKEVRS